MTDEHRKMWEKCAAFHGHECGGLAVGYQASLYAAELLDIRKPAIDEELVCVAENDACGVDAIQALLGCTLGKGNLIVRQRGKLAFNFYHRANGKSVRLVLRGSSHKTKEERANWLMSGDYHAMFDVKEPTEPLPAEARIYPNYTCELCGERMAESHTRLHGGKQVCVDCDEKMKGSR